MNSTGIMGIAGFLTNVLCANPRLRGTEDEARLLGAIAGYLFRAREVAAGEHG